MSQIEKENRMNSEELKKVIEKHHKWLNGEKDGEVANLRLENLRNPDLSRADLSRADLSVANLSQADLSGAYLGGADLSGANIDYSCLPLWC